MGTAATSGLTPDDSRRIRPPSTSAPTTRHARNVEANPACTLALESGTEVAIVQGESHVTRAEPGDLGARISAAFGRYHPEYAPGPGSWSGEDGCGLRVLVPRRALAWFTFSYDCTRFVFGVATTAAG